MEAGPRSPGGTATSTVTVTAQGGYAGTANLTAGGLPAGASASSSPETLALSAATPSAASPLTLAAGTAASGTYPVTVTAADATGSPSASTTVTWTITAPSTGPTALFVDDFDRTTGLGASWRVARGGFTTDGAQAVSVPMTDGGTGNWASVVPSLGTSDYAVETILTVPAGSLHSGIVARSSGGNFTRDLYSAQVATDGTVNLYRRSGRGWTQLGRVAAGIAASPAGSRASRATTEA